MRSITRALTLGRTSLSTAAALFVALSLFAGRAHAAELKAVVQIGPWPAVSNLIAFKGRIWFANSVRYPDHNSADIYSYDPERGTTRFERALFTQDVGRPAVHRGLLYWPYEDPRTSVGWGLVAATDGRDWRLFVIRSDAPSFHVHALAAPGGHLLASSSAWRAGLDVSGDGGLTWRRIYESATTEQSVARILDIATDGRRSYGAAVRWTGRANERSLLSIDADATAEIRGWPRGEVSSMAVFRGALHAVVGGALWTADASRAERIYARGAGPAFALLATDGSALFGLVQSGDGGSVMTSKNGHTWTESYNFSGGKAEDMIVWAGRVFVGGRGTDGRGILWASGGPRSAPPAASAAARWPQTPARANVDWAQARRSLDRAFADPANYGALGRRLRDITWTWIRANPPADFFSKRLAGPFPEGRFNGFGGQVAVERADLGRWMLLWAMATSRTGRVPLDLFGRRWAEAPNRPQKWFHPTPMALFAARWLRQNDRATIDVLVARLDHLEDPAWLRHELMGTLVTLTGQRLGWEPAAWRSWWLQARAAWPE